jgi:hypothetical protein
MATDRVGRRGGDKIMIVKKIHAPISKGFATLV